MHNLEQLIADWRKTMMTGRNVGRETLDELESHLRENVERLVGSGMTEVEAFQCAVTQLGSPPQIASEFQKLNQSTWLPVKLAAAMEITIAFLLAIFLFARGGKLRSDMLLGSHVVLVTLGYMTVFLNGALGICFVGQRCFSDFSASRLQSIRRASFIFSSLAAALTAIAVVLGAIWAKAEWGRYWAWDPKETGGLCVVVWMVFLLCADRLLRRITARGILLMSTLGNIIVSLAWFGANLLDRVHSYGTVNYWLFLFGAVILHLIVFLVGLAPAGWLRLRKT